MARRMWTCLALKEEVWGRPVTQIEKALRRAAPEAHIWFPAVDEKTGEHQAAAPFAPYVFISGPVAGNLARLWCVEKVLATIPESELTASVGKPVPLRAGDDVRITEGPYRGLEGTAVRVQKKHCHVSYTLHSGSRVAIVERGHVEAA